MKDLYLILHKVRGEPTLDVAIRTKICGEEAWITNEGRRAYPCSAFSLQTMTGFIDMPQVPDDLRDHYQVSTPTPTLARRTPKPAPATLDDLGDLLS